MLFTIVIFLTLFSGCLNLDLKIQLRRIYRSWYKVHAESGLSSRRWRGCKWFGVEEKIDETKGKSFLRRARGG